MKCEQVSELASWYVSGDLQPAKRASMEAHLSECPACRAEVEAMRRAVRALETRRQVFEAPDVLDAVKRQVIKPQRTPRPVFGWGFATAGVAAALLGIWFVAGQEPSRPVMPPSQTSASTKQSPTVDTDVKPNLPVAGPRADVHRGPLVAANSDKPSSPVHYHPKAGKTPRLPGRRNPARDTEPRIPATEPRVEYLVVYHAPPAETESAIAGTGGDAHELSADPVTGEPAAPAVSTFCIRMVDESNGTETNLRVEQEYGPDTVERSTVDYTIERDSTHGDERSHDYEDDSRNHISLAADGYTI